DLERQTPASAARPDHRSSHDHAPQHLPTRPPRWRHPRVSTCCVTCTDGFRHPHRCATWADFLRAQVAALLAWDFTDTVTLTGKRMYVLAVIEHASRRIQIEVVVALAGVDPDPCLLDLLHSVPSLLVIGVPSGFSPSVPDAVIDVADLNQ